MGKKLRANQPGVSVAHPETGNWITPNPADLYDESDPLVRAHRWLFSAEDDMPDRGQVVESVPIEQATRAPGEKRGTRRTR